MDDIDLDDSSIEEIAKAFLDEISIAILEVIEDTKKVKKRVEIIKKVKTEKIYRGNGGKVYEYSKEEFEQMAKDSRSINELAHKVYKYNNRKAILRRIKADKIDISHMKGKGWAKDLKIPQNSHPTYTLEEILIENSTYHDNQHLKKRLISNNLMSDKCVLCDQLPMYNDTKLVLQLDHINGNRHDNRIENLRILCPNCHTQTDTFCNKTKKI